MPERPRLTPAVADVRRAVRDALAGLGAEGLAADGLGAGALVLVACSGGPDSLALAAGVAFEAPRNGWRAGAVIVDHGLQEGSAKVAERAADQCRALGLEPVVVRRVEVGKDGGPEGAAREARYLALENVAKEEGATVVMLGHTLDDQAETVLLGLARGSGGRSLSGMSRQTMMPGEGGYWLRPLLGIARATTVAACADAGLEPWLDPHNKEERFARVRVRNQIMPELEAALGPGIAQALARTADTLREDHEFLSAAALAAWPRVATVRPTEIAFDVEQFADQPKAIRHRLVALAVERLAAPAFARIHVLEIDALVDDWHGQKPLALPGVRVERKGNELTLKTTKTLRPGAC